MGKAYNFISYFNQMSFDENEYDEVARIKKKSVLNAAFSATSGSLWTAAFVEFNELIDEVDLF